MISIILLFIITVCNNESETIVKKLCDECRRK